MGTPSDKLAEMAYAFAKGGSISSKMIMDWRISVMRLTRNACGRARPPSSEQARETGRKCHLRSLLHGSLVASRRATSKVRESCGSRCGLMIPGITGLDSMRALAEDPDFGLPIIAHPAITGAMLGVYAKLIRGFSHSVLLNLLPRLAGADATIFPNFGGRFGFSVEECKDIMPAAGRILWRTAESILPSPGGGMTLDKVKKMLETYGQDVLLLVGGSLYSHSSDLTANARYISPSPDDTRPHGPKEARNGFHHNAVQ